MKTFALGIAFAFALVAGGEAAAQRHDEKQHGTPPPAAGNAAPAGQPSVAPSDPASQTIVLKDGTTLVVHSDGTMYHADAHGKRMKMKDGVVMEGKDGKKYLMKNDALWEAITQKGTAHPSHQ